MKRFFFILLALGLSASLFAQSTVPVVVTPVPPQKAAVESSTPLFYPTYFMAELTVSLDAARVRPGDPITAKLLEDTEAAEKLPAGSTLLGRVIEARGHSEQEPQSKLSIVFDKVRVKNGHEIPLGLAIMNIEAPPPVTVRRSSNDDFASLNSAAARAAGPTTSNGKVNQPSYAPSRDIDYSGPIRDPLWDKRPNMPARNPSGLHDVEMTTIKQGAEIFTVLVSDRRTIKLNKHYLVHFMIAQAGAQATPR